LPFYTYLAWVELTVEGPDAGEAADDVDAALKGLRGIGTGLSPVAVVNHELWPRWWRARPVEVLVAERARTAQAKRKKIAARKKNAAQAKRKK